MPMNAQKKGDDEPKKYSFYESINSPKNFQRKKHHTNLHTAS